jgi:hypothetical protein
MGALGSRRTARDHLLFGMGLALGAGLAIILGTLKNMRTPTGERLLLPGLTVSSPATPTSPTLGRTHLFGWPGRPAACDIFE